MAKKNANLGKVLEDKIIKQNEFYLKNNLATIKKVPNAWVVRRKGPHIVGANPVPSGLCDFVGTSKLIGGRMIVFDAKETKNKTTFPLNNIKPSQMDHMQETIDHGGIGFLVVWFTEMNETYVINHKQIRPFWEYAEQNPDEKGAKSIKLQFFQEECKRIDDLEYLEQAIK